MFLDGRLIVLQGLEASHEECYRFAKFWEPGGLTIGLSLLAGPHIVLQGKSQSSPCELGPRLCGCTESIACRSHTLATYDCLQAYNY